MKKFLWSAFLLLLILFIYTFIDTYGLLESNGSANVDYQIGKWNITLNGVDVTVTSTINEDDLIYEDNNNVETGYFAPGVTGTYNIEIDPMDTDVSIRYDITADLSDLATHPNITFSMSGDVIQRIQNGVTIYSGVIPLSSIKQGTKANLTALLIWNNNEDYNEQDNILEENTTPLNIKITARFTQYLGEEL